MTVLRSSCMAIVVLLGTACSKTPPPASESTFTLATGVETIEVSDCKETTERRKLDLQPSGSAYLLDMTIPSDCGSILAEPYLTLSVDNKTTLVLRAARDAGFHSGCECLRTAKVKISGRLEKGDTLYVSYEGEVLGHRVID